MSIVLGQFSAVLGLDNSSYTRGILESQAVTQVFGQTFTTFVTNPVLGGIQVFGDLAGAAVSLGKTMVESSRGILSTAEEVQRLGQQTGLTVETIQAVREELELVFGQGEQAGEVLVEFTKRLGEATNEGGQMARSFARAGIDVESFSGTTDEALRTVLAAIAALNDETDQQNLVDRIFGGQGKFLVNAIDAAGGMDSVREKWEQFIGLLDQEQIDYFAELNTQIGLVSRGARAIGEEFLEQVLLKIAGKSEITEDAIIAAVQNIRDVVIPFGEELGARLVEIINNLDDLLKRLDAIGGKTDIVRIGLQAGLAESGRQFSNAWDFASTGEGAAERIAEIGAAGRRVLSQ